MTLAQDSARLPLGLAEPLKQTLVCYGTPPRRESEGPGMLSKTKEYHIAESRPIFGDAVEGAGSRRNGGGLPVLVE